MEKYKFTEEELATKVAKAANEIFKDKEYIPASYIYAPWIPVADLRLGESKAIILKVKDWLIDKRKKEAVEINKKAYEFHSIDAEEELTKILTEEISIAIREEQNKIRDGEIGDFSPKKEIAESFATKKVNPNFYGTIKIGS